MLAGDDAGAGEEGTADSLELEEPAELLSDPDPDPEPLSAVVLAVPFEDEPRLSFL